MDLGCLRRSGRALVCFYLSFLLLRDCHAQICSAPASANVEENKPPGTPVLLVTAETGVTFELMMNPENYFRLEEATVVVNIPLDYELIKDIKIRIRCIQNTTTLDVEVLILVQNVNDISPEFAFSQYNLNTPELAPVGTTVDPVVEATDAEGDLLFYHMDPEYEYFKMKSPSSPIIVVNKTADYDIVQRVSFTLIARDTRMPGVGSLSAMTNVTISIMDVDNRPPWFRPCKETVIGSSRICLGSGYRGRVNLTVKMEGVLTLDPGPVLAIDGDRGRNETILYRIVGGSDIFQMDENTGDITMLKPVDVAGPIVLTVLAWQALNPDQFATTTVTFDVVMMSQSPPQFDKQLYEGFISSDAEPGSMVLEDKTLDKPLRVQARDTDFVDGTIMFGINGFTGVPCEASVQFFDGVNPNMRYSVEEGSGFSVTGEGFILLESELSSGTVKVRAEDTSNGEFNTTTVSIQRIPGATTAMTTTTGVANVTTSITIATTPTYSSVPMTTQIQEGTTGPGTAHDTGATTAMTTTTGVANVTTSITIATTPTYSSVPMTTQIQEGTAGPGTAHGTAAPGMTGPYGEADMAALGASLAVLLALCLAIIGLLVFRIRKGDTAWKKLSEASLFQSMLARGSGGLKEGVQYTNSGFQNDGDTGSVTSDPPNKTDLALDAAGLGVGNGTGEIPPEVRAALVAATLQEDFLPDGSSLAGSDRADSEKEVKPILTKERRNEEGYKSVWFKEDIDPNAKEEVLIIPDSGEHDADEEEEEDDEEDSVDGDEDVSPPDTPSALQMALGGEEESREEGEDSNL